MQNSEQAVHCKLLEISQWAVSVHSFHTKKDNGKYRKHFLIPFFTHIIEVMKRVSHYGINFENKDLDKEVIFNTLALAVCHDLYEDTTVKEKDFIEKAGFDISELVKMTTRKDGYESRLQKWDFLEGFMDGWQHPSAIVVKIADRYCNVIDYHRRDEKYAAFYALQAFPLYKAFLDDTSYWTDDIINYVIKDIDEMSLIVKKVYGKGINEFDIEEVKRIVI